MKVSINWLKDYVAAGVPPEKLAYKLTMAGLEVEKVSSSSGDKVLELEITPNRPDCLSVLGIARETAAILNKKRSFPKTTKRVWPKTKCAITIDDKKGCSRYIGTVVENVSIKKAQEKITKRLSALGMRSINNVVDITNFCLMETGQPLHAFDYDKLAGGKIIVRRARKGETIITLDDIERKLDPSILVIADAKRAVAIAGVMGGKNTEVTKTTKNIFLESAYFNPVLIRRASRKLGLSSDSSYRFERGVDYPMVAGAVNRALDLILDSAKGKITKHSDIVAGTKKAARSKIAISKDQINAYTGASLSLAQCKNILKKLDFHVTGGGSGAFRITPPSFRGDINEPVDIVEEISRIVGYDNLPLTFPQVNATEVVSDTKRNCRRHVRDILTAQGLNEVITYALTNRKSLECSGQAHLQGISITNPLTQDQEIMRPSMLPSLLAIVQSNINRGQKNIKFFETGKIYTAQGEQDTLSIIMTGLSRDDWRQTEKNSVDYYDLKGVVEEVFECRNIKKMHFTPLKETCFVPGQGARILIDGKDVGVLGKIEDSVLSRWDIKQQGVFYAQIDLKVFYRQRSAQRKYKKISEFPVINRDISLAVKTNITAQTVEETIRKVANGDNHVALTDIKFIELYEGKKIPKNHRGLIFSLTYQSRLAKTLRDEEVEGVHKRVCDALIHDLGVVQR